MHRQTLRGRRTWTLGLLALAVLLASNSASARVWNIKADGTGDLATIQDAADITQPGDIVRVHPGTYSWTTQRPGETGHPHGMIVLWTTRPTGVTFESTDGPEVTILDAEGKSRVMFANGDNPPSRVEFTIRGFTLRNGVAPEPPNSTREPDAEGGGLVMHLAYATIENCIFEDNWAEAGGGVWLGGVSSCIFRDCVFRNNTAWFGGGLYVINSEEHTLIEDCVFENNAAVVRGDSFGGHGGGLWCGNNIFTVQRCLFIGNEAVDTGAGFFGALAKPGILRNNVFRDHETDGQAVSLFGDPSATSEFDLSHNVITETRPGGAVRLEPDADATFTCNDFFLNSGGDWSGPTLSPFLGRDGNVSEDPLYCSEDSANLSVCQDSPLLAANNTCGEDIGLSEAGCDSCGTSEPEPEPSAVFRTHPSAPNPFFASSASAPAVILYDLPAGGHVRAIVYDLTGRRVRTLEDGSVAAGAGHSLEWNGTDETGGAVASGVYVCRVEAGGEQSSQRIVLVR